MILYHFTSGIHANRIYKDGVLKPVESNVSMTEEHAGPDVVWFTDDPENKDSHWDAMSVLDKTEMRITVDVPDAVKWSVFSKKHHIDLLWLSALNSVGGSEHWWVVERPVTRNEWKGMERVKG